jgi:hypothetical protein
MANPIEEVLNLESATAEELGRLFASQPQTVEESPTLIQGPRRAKPENRELHAHSFDAEGLRQPK